MPNDRREEHTHETGTKRLSLKAQLAAVSGFKRQTYYALEDIPRGRPLAKFIGIALFVLILLNAALVFVSTQPGLDPIASNIINAFYTFSTVCFMLEYISRIWIANLVYRNRTHAKARLHYMASPLGIIDLLSFAPNVVAWFFPVTPVLRVLINLVRLIRLIKISRYMRGLRAIGRVLKKRQHEIVASFLVLLLLIVVSSVVMYEIEHPAQPDKFNNLLSGVYWAVETITGTGYGDLVPITPLGRIVGSVIMFLSVALVAIPGGIFSAGFVAEFQNTRHRRTSTGTGTSSGASNANKNGSTGDSTNSSVQVTARQDAPAPAAAPATAPESAVPEDITESASPLT